MRHKEIERLVHKRLDKEITKKEEVVLFKHIENCPECRDFFLEMERLRQEIFNLPEYFPGIDFNTRVISAIKVKRHIPWYKAIPVFGGIYLAGLVILFLTPLPHYLFSKLIFKLPGLVHIFDKIRPIGNGLFLLASSFLKINQLPIFAGILFILVVFIAFGETLKTKEA